MQGMSGDVPDHPGITVAAPAAPLPLGDYLQAIRLAEAEAAP